MSTNLNNRAQEATEEIFNILGVRPTGEQGDKVVEAIEGVIVKAMKKSAERSAEAASEALAADKVMANKITDEIQVANNILIANLTAMR